LHLISFEASVPAIPLLFSLGLIAAGELLLVPAVLSYCSEIAPTGMKGMTMGLVTVAFSIANLLSGMLGQLGTAASGEIAEHFFIGIALLAFMLFLAMVTGIRSRYNQHSRI
jgi:dipeptide/tripeptide permease